MKFLLLCFALHASETFFQTDLPYAKSGEDDIVAQFFVTSDQHARIKILDTFKDTEHAGQFDSVTHTAELEVKGLEIEKGQIVFKTDDRRTFICADLRGVATHACELTILKTSGKAKLTLRGNT